MHEADMAEPEGAEPTAEEYNAFFESCACESVTKTLFQLPPAGSGGAPVRVADHREAGALALAADA